MADGILLAEVGLVPVVGVADEAGVAVGHELLQHPRPRVQLGQPFHRREGAVQ